MGVASAGSAAVARDPGTAYFNPAGMTRVPGTQLLLGAHAMFIDVRFRGSSQSLFRGGNGGQAGEILPGLGLYFVTGLCGDKAKFGLAINAPYGGAFNYGRKWIGRYFVQRELLPVLAFNPTFAMRVKPWLSLGGGFTVEYGYLLQAIALNPAVFGLNPLTNDDGRLELNMDNVAYGYNLGALVELSPCTRFGVAYRSQIRHKMRGVARTTPKRVTTGVDTTFKFAQFVIASVYHQLTCNLALLANVGWENWKVMDRTVLTSDDDGVIILPRNWKDTWHVAVGTEYRWCDPLLLQAGVSYDSSPANSKFRSPDLPVDRQIRYALGAIYTCNACETLSTAIEYVDGGNASIDRKGPNKIFTLLKGRYRRNDLLFFNFTYNRKF